MKKYFDELTMTKAKDFVKNVKVSNMGNSKLPQ